MFKLELKVGKDIVFLIGCIQLDESALIFFRAFQSLVKHRTVILYSLLNPVIVSAVLIDNCRVFSHEKITDIHKECMQLMKHDKFLSKN